MRNDNVITSLIDKLLFLTIFFSFAFIFRVNIMGYSIYYYQLFGICTILLIFIKLYNEKMVLSKEDIKIILLMILMIFTCIMSFFFIQNPTNYSYEQYIKGIITLIINYSILITLLVYISIESNKYKKCYLSFIKKVLQINIVYGIIQLIAYIFKINTNAILVKLLKLNPPYDINPMGVFIRVSGLTWDANFYAYQLLLYIFLVIYLYKHKIILKRYDKMLFFISFILLFLTFSRSVILGLLIFLLLIVTADLKKKYIHKLLRYLEAVSIILLLIFIKLSNILMPIFWARFGFLVNNKYITESTLSRVDFINLGVKLLIDNPFGIGNNNLSSYALINFEDSFFKLHNAFLQIGVENGIIAMFLFVLLLYKLVFFDNKFSIYRIAMFFSIIIINMFYDQASYVFNLIFLIIFMSYQISLNKRYRLD